MASFGLRSFMASPASAFLKAPRPRRRVVLVQPDELVILVVFLALLFLGAVTDTDTFEPLDRSRLTYLTAIGLPLVLLVSAFRRRFRRIASSLTDWWQVLAALGIYESLKHLHANRITEWLGIKPKDALMIRADEWLFGRVLPLWFEPISSDAVVHVMWFFYVWVYYLGPILSLGFVYFVLEDDALFLRLRKALVLVLLGGYVSYLLVPVAGPLFNVGEQFTRPIATQPVLRSLVFEKYRYNWDCFPSLHTAVPWTLSLVLWPRLGNRSGRPIAVLACSGVTLSTLVLRFHYGVDVLAGLAWAAMVALFVAKNRWVQSPLEIPIWSPDRSKLRAPHLRLACLGFVFVLTGVAALLAEQAFEKLLSTLVGSSTEAAAIVLGVYFLGLTIGAAAYGLVASRIANPLMAFACLEAGVALWAILLALFDESAVSAFVPLLIRGAASAGTLALARTAVASLFILPPTLLMGATFPAVVGALEMMRDPAAKRGMSTFYTLNLVGAFLGAILGPYLVFPTIGVDGTLLFTAFLDSVACLSIFLLGRARRWRPLRPAPEGPGQSAAPNRGHVLLGVCFVSGFIFFSLEVLWTHLISAVLGNSIYSFAIMLALVLASLMLGGACASLLFRKDRSIAVVVISGALVAASVALSVQTVLWPHVPHSFSRVHDVVTTFAGAEAVRWVLAAGQLLPSATLLGFVYPALFRLREFPDVARARFVGRAAAANAVGCLAGAVATGFVLIPRLGSERTLQAFAVLCALSGVALSIVFDSRLGKVRLGALGAAASVIALLQPRWDLLALTSGEHVYFERAHVWQQSKLVFFREDTASGMTTVVDNPAGVRQQTRPFRTLLTNGKFQGNDAWESSAQLGIALIPLLYTRGFHRACIVGLGTGQTASVPVAFGFSEVDIAELAPGIVSAAPYFARINHSVLTRPTVRLSLEDGRNWFLVHPELRCDFISVEVHSVWFAGATNVYSRQFYELTKARLGQKGVLQQWIQLHHIGVVELATVIATVRSVYDHVSFWVYGRQGIIVASASPLTLSAEAMRRFFAARPELGFDSDASAGTLLEDVLGSRLLTSAEVSSFVARNDYELNTDQNRYLEYATAKYNVSRVDYLRDNVRWLSAETTFPAHEIPPDLPSEYRLFVEHSDPRRVTLLR